MIAVDTNILVYSYDEAAPLHDRALSVLSRLVDEPAWGLPWIVAGEFYSVLTNPRRFVDADRGRVRSIARTIRMLRLRAAPWRRWEAESVFRL